MLLDLATGEERAVGVVPYPHGVIDRELPEGGGRVGADWALQDPDDWGTVLEEAIATPQRESPTMMGQPTEETIP